MKNSARHLLTLSAGGLFLAANAFATNPLIMDQFTADPTARVFEDRIFVYPSHDIPFSPGKGRTNWFIMEDYHTFSSENLTDWKDHGVIVSQTTTPWTATNGYAMWAPDCVFKNGKYYFYFPAPGKGGRGSSVGVAISDRPFGPFIPEPTAMTNIGGIDPGLLIDDDGSAYIYVAMGRISVAKLKENMVEVESRPVTITNLPTQGTLEGPFPLKRNGIYYLTYPHVANKIERLEYAMSKSPFGPFTPAGVILDESASGCWTVHHSLVEYKGQWILFYHDRDLSPNFDKNRSIRADYLTFNEDGTIKKVIPTLRGIGIVNAKSKIQLDRYSAISPAGVTNSFLNPTNTFEGWKVTLNGKNTWVEFDRVDFGAGGLKTVYGRVASATGGAVEVHIDKVDGPLVAKVAIDKGEGWDIAKAHLANTLSGVHDLFVTQPADGIVDIDWLSFE